MAATIIDSRIFGDIFSSAAMRQVWSDENRTAKYIDVEKALAIVQGRLGIIPHEAADEIVRNCDADQVRPGHEVQVVPLPDQATGDASSSASVTAASMPLLAQNSISAPGVQSSNGCPARVQGRAWRSGGCRGSSSAAQTLCTLRGTYVGRLDLVTQSKC